ncbi:transposase [Streptomyces olivaceoviridis]|uniref:transposase n=1 Tax=Streptomyces olivaceoviridis TaxID=1921 RepID=UPI0036B15D79
MEEGDLAAGKSTAAARGAWLVFADEAGQSMTPPRSKTWGRVGRIPVVRVRGRGSGRMSMAGMVCYRPGARSRLLYAIREYYGRKDEPKGFGWRDLRNLLVRARIQLGGPIVLVWDNVRLHLAAGMREFVAANTEWLTVFQLPAYAPDLNPQEGIWSLVKRDLGNLAAADLGEITRAVKHRLKKIQYRPDLIDGCLVGTGLSPHSGEPTTNQPDEGSGTAGSPIEQLGYRRAAGCPGRGALLTGG